MRHSHNPQKGSLLLVVLCLISVLGIALAGYLAVSNQSMKLSNRSYVKEVSMRLAEMGMEEAMRALNQNSFSDWTVGSNPNRTTADWTITGTTASCTITLPAQKFGSSGIIGSVKVRIDYNSAAVWDASTSYSTSDMVYYRGVWLKCKLAHANQRPPNTTYWISAPAAWSPDANYETGDIVLVGGVRYVCSAANCNRSPPDASYWDVGSAAALWNSATNYNIGEVALSGGTAYRCIAANANQAPPDANYWIGAPAIFSEGVATLPDSDSTTITTQLRATLLPAPAFPNAVAASSILTFSAGGTVDSYNSPLALPWSGGTTYNAGDVVSSGSNFYRCILAHSPSRLPSTNPTYWTTSPLGYSAVLAGGSSSGNAVIVASATVSGYVAAPPSATSPFTPRASFGTSPAASVKGASSPASPNVDLTRVSRSPNIPQFEVATWNGSTGYRLNDIVRSGSDLYVCKLAHTNQAPPNATYWTGKTLLPAGSPTIGAPGATISNYYSATIDLGSGESITIQGPVVLDVRGDLLLKDGGNITITSTGSAEIHVSGRIRIGLSATPATTGIDNQTKDPKKLILIGTATSTALTNRYNCMLPLYGIIYMRDISSAIDIMSDIFGAVSAKSVDFPNGTADLHYDTSLRTARFRSLVTPFILTEWRELTDPAEKVTLP